MPIYEYRCRDCRRNASIFFRSIAMAADPVCPHCGSHQLDKRMSRVSLRRGRSDHRDLVGDGADGIEGDWGGSPASCDDPFGAGMVEDDADPRQLASRTRQMSRQMGEPLDPDLDRALSDIERGADPDDALDQLEDLPPPDPDS